MYFAEWGVRKLLRLPKGSDWEAYIKKHRENVDVHEVDTFRDRNYY